MRSNKYYWFENDAGTYHSGAYRDPAECKGAAKQYCMDRQENVKLCVMDPPIGHTYGRISLQNGEPVFYRARG